MEGAVRMTRDLVFLGLITVLALVLRLWHLDSGLWYDEVLTLVDFVRLPASQIVQTYTSLNNHVFFTLQAHLSTTLLGEGAWQLRLPAVLFGVATVPLLWVLVRRIGAPKPWAYVCALLLAVSYHHIWFSQNARGYTGLIFWCLAATLAFVEGTKRPAWGPWIWFSIAATAAMYTHLSAAFYLVSLGLVYLWCAVTRPAALPGLASARPLIVVPLTSLLVLALYAPMIPDMLAAFQNVATPTVAETGGEEAMAVWRSPLWTLLEILRSLPVPLPVTLVMLPVLLSVLAFGFVGVWHQNRAVALVVPVSIVVSLVLLTLGGMRLWPRYFLPDLPLLLLFATAGAAGLAGFVGRITGRVALLTTVFWCFGIAASSLWAVKNYTAPKQDFTGAVALMRADSEPGARLGSIGLASLPVSTYFAPDWPVIESRAELDTLMAEGAPVWLMWAFDDHTRKTFPDIMERVERDFERVARLPGTLSGGSVYVVRSREARS